MQLKIYIFMVSVEKFFLKLNLIYTQYASKALYVISDRK